MLGLLVQVANFTKLIQASDVKLRCQKGPEKCLLAGKNVSLDFPCGAVEVEDVHVVVVFIVLVVVVHVAVCLYTLDQCVTALGLVSKSLEC